MPTEILVPIVLGAATVMQAALNREIATHTGLANATALNMFVGACWGFGLLLYGALRHETGGLFRGEWQTADLRWWWLVPGAVGFAIVLGLPWAVQRIGALATFVALVGAQMIASALWDRFIDGIPLSWPRIAGAVSTLAGVALMSWKPSA